MYRRYFCSLTLSTFHVSIALTCTSKYSCCELSLYLFYLTMWIILFLQRLESTTARDHVSIFEIYVNLIFSPYFRGFGKMCHIQSYWYWIFLWQWKFNYWSKQTLLRWYWTIVIGVNKRTLYPLKFNLS